jgi:dTDP-4-dehydrorhamnose reductase
MRILVFGAKGMLGSMVTFVGVSETKHEIIPLTRDDFDVEKDSLEKLESIACGGAWVVNCIGAIPQKKPTEEQYRLLNEEFPHKLSAWCKQKDMKLIHISTNCVFSGKHPDLVETDIPDEEEIYGKTKAKGEPLDYGLTFRCSIIGPEVEGRVSGLMEWFFAQEGKIQGYTDHSWNGLTTLELARKVYNFLDINYSSEKLLHFWSNTVSKYDLLCMLRDMSGKQIEIEPVSKGRKYYTLKSLFTPPNSLEEQIYELFKKIDGYDNFYKKNKT